MYYIQNADLQNYEDVVKQEINHRKIKDDQIVFKIKQKYRIEVIINYDSGDVLILRIGTHESYNKWKFN